MAAGIGFRLSAALLVLAVSALAATEQVSPIQKVVQMMNDMMAKSKGEKQDETVRFAQFKVFCEMTSEEKTHTIAENAEQVEQLKVEIQQSDADAAKLAKEISAINSDVAVWQADVKTQTAQREEEHKDFLATHKDYTESIDSVERAVKTMKEKTSMAQTQAALIELSSRVHTTANGKRLIASFLQKGDSIQTLLQDEVEFKDGAPEPAAYNSASGGIQDMVEKLGDKFGGEREAAEKREMNMKQSFLMMTSELNQQIEHGQEEVQDKMTDKTSADQTKAQAEATLGDVLQALAEDQKFLADLTAECELKSSDYAKRQEVRQGELEAIAKAIEIMTSDSVTGGSFLQVGMSTRAEGLALGQLRSRSHSTAQNLVAEFLSDRARSSDSKVLELIAAKTFNEPFKKVTKMIEDMIMKLMEEANEETEHKGFCDAEMGANKMTRDAKTEEAAKLKAEIDELTADVAKIAQEKSDLEGAIGDINAGVTKALAQREMEKEKNQATITDAKVAQEATAQALTVLKEFYEKAANPMPSPEQPKGPIKYDPRAIAIITKAGGGSLAQVPGAPEMESGGFTGGNAGGIVGMLEVIESDFAAVVSETTSSESDAQRSLDEFMHDSTKDKAIKGADIKHLGTAQVEKESELASAKKDMRVTEEELGAAMKYFEKLKPSCVDAGQSYEDRVAKRKEEIESLKEALKILSE